MTVNRIKEFSNWGASSSTQSATGRVDVEAGVIRGVKLLGLESSNGRTYLKEAVARAAHLYEGAKVNVDHPVGKAGTPRSYSDRIGIIENVRVEPDGLYADFHANPKHAMWEQLAWDAANSPQSVGFSHNIRAKTAVRNGKIVVEEIVTVSSVDIVADPATTRGLFESATATNHHAAANMKQIMDTAAVVGVPRHVVESLTGISDDADSGRERVISIAKYLKESGLLPVDRRPTVHCLSHKFNRFVL